jgi:hypothetical protein
MTMKTADAVAYYLLMMVLTLTPLTLFAGGLVWVTGKFLSI